MSASACTRSVPGSTFTCTAISVTTAVFQMNPDQPVPLGFLSFNGVTTAPADPAMQGAREGRGPGAMATVKGD